MGELKWFGKVLSPDFNEVMEIWYIVQKKQIELDFKKWGDEFCEHAAKGYAGGNNRLRRECPKCWNSLGE